VGFGGFAAGAGFPAAVDPDPLVGVFADDAFDGGGVECGSGDDVCIAIGGIQRFDNVVMNDAVFLYRLIPDRKRRHDESVRPDREHGDTACRARRNSEKRDEDTFFRMRVHIGQHADRPAAAQRADDLGRGIRLVDLAVAEARAYRSDHFVDERIVHLACEEGERFEKYRIRERLQFPVAEMAAYDNAAAALFDRAFVSRVEFRLGFVDDEIAEILGREIAEMRDRTENATEILERTFQKLFSFGQRLFGKGELEVSEAYARELCEETARL